MKYDKIEYQLVEVKKMTVKINTKDGQIELTDEVIATVVGGAATEIFGVVGMASKIPSKIISKPSLVRKIMQKVLS